jgi:RNA polymerase sigma factor (TIGR02999 family)
LVKKVRGKVHYRVKVADDPMGQMALEWDQVGVPKQHSLRCKIKYEWSRWSKTLWRQCGCPAILVAMSDVTRILSQIEQGDPQAAEQLLPLVYNELRKLAAARLAQEKPGQTLQATALVHEAYLRLVGPPPIGEHHADVEAHNWNSRGHFFGAAAEAMRRILVESSRQKQRLKRGGNWERLSLAAVDPAAQSPPVDVLALDEALTDLDREHPQKAQLVKLRYFAGLTLDEAAAALGISTATADRHWRYARAWLAQRLRDDATSES